MRLILIRHPQPSIRPGICYGSSDVAVAVEETRRSTLALAPALPRKYVIVSSPLRRCADLARALAHASSNPTVEFDARLVELDFGSWEMRAWEDIAHAEVDAWAAAPVTWRPGGGERVLEMAHRVREFYESKTAEAGDCVVVCHAGTIRLLLACRQHRAPADIAAAAIQETFRPAYGERVVVDQT